MKSKNHLKACALIKSATLVILISLVISLNQMALGVDPSPSWRVQARCFVDGPSGSFDDIAVKDPSIVYSGGRYHLFYTGRDSGLWRTGYASATSISGLDGANRTLLSLNATDYFCAPQVFWFEPQGIWYLIYQSGLGGPTYSTNSDISNPSGWTNGQTMGFDDGGYDFFCISDGSNMYIFYAAGGDSRTIKRRSTSVANFPYNWSSASTVATDTFEGTCVYKNNADGQYYMLNEDINRHYELWTASSLGGTWTKVSEQWAHISNLIFEADHWTDQVSHGELIRAGTNERMEVDDLDSCTLLFQGVVNGDYGDYGNIPYDLGTANCLGGGTTTTTSGGGNITMRARGDDGSEILELRAGGSTIGTWTMSTNYQNYSANGSGTVQVCFTNDQGDTRDAQCDYVIIDGTTYQSEDQADNTAVWQDGSCGGSYSEWLHCNGCITYDTGGATTSTTTTAASTTTTAATTTTTAATTTTTAATTTTTSGGGCDCGTCDWYGTNIPMCCESCSGWGWYDGGCRRSCVCPGSCPGGSTTTTAATTTTTAATTTTTAATTSTTAATTSTTTTTAATTSTTTTAATTTTTAATTTTTAGAGCTCDSGCDGTAISPNFTQNGSGQYCWQATSGTYINSWNLAKLEVNDADYTNTYAFTSSFPAKINGVWYIYYNSSVSWGHFELNN